MNKQSYLDAPQLRRLCDECIELIRKDLSERAGIDQGIQIVIEDIKASCEGEGFEAYISRLAETKELLYKAIEADDCDIRDLEKLRGQAVKTYDGNLICSSYERAHKDRDENLKNADIEKQLAASFNTVIKKVLPSGVIIEEHIRNPHEENEKMYRKAAAACQSEMEMWHKKMLEFDTIEAQTAKLFLEGLEIRKECFHVDYYMNKNNGILIDGIPDGDFGLGILEDPNDIQDAVEGQIGIKVKKKKTALKKSQWLIDNAKKYGLTEMEARYLEEYYPTLVNSLYGLSQTDHQGYIDLTLKDIKTKLKDDYFYMMEEYGYSYEAIRYLHENNPGLIAALDSHYGPASISDVRMEIYTYLLDQGICVYDPVYDFDEYNVKSGEPITGNEVQFHTNCYSYAFGITRDPRTGELLPENGLQPGHFSGLEDEFRRNKRFIYSADPKNDGTMFLKYIKADAKALGLSFEEYEEGMTGGVRVALVLDPINTTDEIPDYHWYYFDEESGKWFNKQGSCPATDRYLGNAVNVYSPQKGFTDDQGVAFCRDGKYRVIDLENPIGGGEDDYYNHGISCGPENDRYEGYYQINVGEFYITRLDGGDFN